MEPRAAAIIIVLAAVALVIQVPALVVAQAPASLTTDQALYTLRDKQVTLQGSGYGQSKPYVVWLKTPLDNSTRAIGLTFTTTSKGELPPAVSIPIGPDSPLGTYLVSISNSTKSDAAIAQAHYGIWGPDKFVYQRTEVVQARGGGIRPKASLKVTIRNPAGNFVHDETVAANETGNFLAKWKIPPDAMTESYTVFIDGVGTYDSPDKEFVSISKFSVTPALLNVTILTQPNALYERTRAVSADLAVRYPDSSVVVSIKEGLKPVALYAGQFKVADLGLAASGAASGVWTVQFRIPKNASLDLNYKFVLAAKAFDDGNGNIGSEEDIETNSFNIIRATLQVTTTLNSTYFQVPFDTMTAYTRINYPDGELVANVTVRAWLTAAGSRLNTTVVYDKTAAVWVAKYTFSLGDVLRPGSWSLSVEAKDIYGNAGSASVGVVAEPYLFLEIVVVVLAAILIVRWLLSRFWRRLYLGAKRIMGAVRGRLRPPSVGRYFSDSPVTP